MLRQDELFGPYVIEEKIGAGGMAMVYKAVDRRTGATVALKVLHTHFVADKETMGRFKREARIVQQLNHPHIVPIFELGDVHDQLYLAMRYMAGGSLRLALRAETQVAVQDSLLALGQIAAALDYAHQQGIVHRDLKLENVLLDEEGVCYLSDFGLARMAGVTAYT